MTLNDVFQLQRLYTAAIALNNMAISLIERGLYSPASETLNSAASIMKDISQLSLIQASCPQGEDTRRKTFFMVRRAESYLGRSGPKPHSAILAIRVVNEDFAASAIGTKDDDLTVRDKHDIVVIRMEVGSIQDLRYRDPNVDSSLILFNLACVQLCRAFTSDLRISSHEFLKSAQRLFLFSLTVLENVIDDKEAAIQGNGETNIGYILPAVIIVLRNLTRTASILGQHEDVERFSSQADSFEEFFTEETYLSLLFAPLSGAAAA